VRQPRFFYGWVIVGISVVSLVLIYGVRHSFAVFFPPILEEFGWSRGSTAAMYSLNVLVYGLLGPVAGGFADRWKPTRVIPLGIVILALATAGCAFANQLWHFYLLFGVVMPAGTAFCGWPVLGPSLANWFSKKRGLAIGLGQAGGGLSFVYSMFAEFAISQMGWRHAYFVLAGMLVLFLLPLSRLFHYRPEDRGLEPYGAGEAPAADATTGMNAVQEAPRGDWTLRSAMKTYRLWLMVLSYFFFWGMGNYLVLAHQVKFVQDAGYSSAFAASVFALFGVFMIAGQVSSSISDRLGRETTVALAAVLAMGAMAALLSVRDASQPWLLYVHSVALGLGAGLYAPTGVAAMADIFHGRHFGAIAGLLLTGQGLGGAIGPWLGGHIYDISGSYSIAFVISMVGYGVAAVALFIAAPRKGPALRVTGT
jgi:sugar phosphate permease